MNGEVQSPIAIGHPIDYDWFTLHIGALSPSEKGSNLDLAKEYQRTRMRQSLAQNLSERSFVILDGDDLKIQTLDDAGFFTKIAYYFGWYQASMTKGVEKICAKRMNQVQEFKSEESPKTLIELRNVCVRVRCFSQEIFGMRQAIEKGRSTLDEATDELNFLAWHICKLAQWIISSCMRTAKTPKTIKNMHFLLIGTQDGGYGGIIEELRRGKFAELPQAYLGVRIGETDLATDLAMADAPKGLESMHGFMELIRVEQKSMIFQALPPSRCLKME